MNNDQPHSENHLTAKQMQDYLTGNLSDAEMHRIEKHLLKCDFCAEAMEGLESLNDASTFAPAVSDLKKKVEERIHKSEKEKPVVPFYKKALRIAAMLAVLIVASVLVTNYFKSDVKQKEFSEKKKTEIPKEIKPREIEGKKQNLTSKESAGNLTEKQELKNVKSPKGSQKTTKSEPDKAAPEIEEKINLVDHHKQAESIEPVAEDKRMVMKEVDYDKAEVDEAELENKKITVVEYDREMEMTTADEALPVSAPERSIYSAKGAKSRIAAIPSLRQLSGKVVTEDNTPVPYVSISIKDNENGTASDEEGKFVLMLPEGDQTLIVSSIGFETKEIAVARQDTLSIILRSNDIALDAMVVTSNAVSGQKKSKSKKKIIAPQPINGKAYQQYLKDSLRYPEAALEAKIKGNIILKFRVGPKGEITQIKVIKGLGYGCDEEAIRLLSEGPKWVPGSEDGMPTEMESELKVKFK